MFAIFLQFYLNYQIISDIINVTKNLIISSLYTYFKSDLENIL